MSERERQGCMEMMITVLSTGKIVKVHKALICGRPLSIGVGYADIFLSLPISVNYLLTNRDANLSGNLDKISPFRKLIKIGGRSGKTEKEETFLGNSDGNFLLALCLFSMRAYINNSRNYFHSLSLLKKSLSSVSNSHFFHFVSIVLAIIWVISIIAMVIISFMTRSRVLTTFFVLLHAFILLIKIFCNYLIFDSWAIKIVVMSYLDG